MCKNVFLYFCIYAKKWLIGVLLLALLLLFFLHYSFCCQLCFAVEEVVEELFSDALLQYNSTIAKHVTAKSILTKGPMKMFHLKKIFTFKKKNNIT